MQSKNDDAHETRIRIIEHDYINILSGVNRIEHDLKIYQKDIKIALSDTYKMIGSLDKKFDDKIDQLHTKIEISKETITAKIDSNFRFLVGIVLSVCAINGGIAGYLGYVLRGINALTTGHP